MFKLSTTSLDPSDKASKSTSQKKILNSLFRKFKWKFFLLFLFTFLISCLTFLIRFNLVNNLSSDRGRGHFFYLFGKYQIIKKIEDNKIYVDWSKLLLILFLLYFPLKIIFHLTLNYWRKNYEREVKVCLTKKLLNYAAKNKDLMTKRTDEKLHIINEVVPEFSCQFINIPVGLFEIMVDISFVTFNVCFLISSYQLSQLVPLLVIFTLVNLTWFAFFYYFSSSPRQAILSKKNNYQNLEKAQIKTWTEGLHLNNQPRGSKNLSKLLDDHSQQITGLNFLSSLYQLPELIISGISIFFLFLYYQIYCGGEGGLSWSIYFVANNLQMLFFKIKKGFNLLSTIPVWQRNYRKIEGFFC